MVPGRWDAWAHLGGVDFIEWVNCKEAPGLPLLITFKDLKMILAQVKDGNFDCLSWMNLPDMTQVLL